MRGVASVLRILTFAAAVYVLWFMRTPVIHAQFGGSCIRQYETEDGSPCFDCCPNNSNVAGIITGVADSSPGFYSESAKYVDCGGGTCNGGDCGTTLYYVAEQDGSCCIPAGDPCNQGTCCNGLQCLSDNTCGTCIGDYQSCSVDSDCCSGFCDPDIHECSFPCIPFGEECSYDGECCSGACIAGYCDFE